MTDAQIKCYEVEIPVPYGKIAAKWYGSQDIRPILIIHGFGDNCGSFDRLIPLLPSQGSYLAIDLPGYGRSSRLPNGMLYTVSDIFQIVTWIMKTYNWSTVSLMGHCMGAMMCFIFAALYPSKVDLFIGLDGLQLPHYDQTLDQVTAFIDQSMKYDEANIKNLPPKEYTYEQLIDKIHNIPSCEIPKDLCHYLLHRNIRKSTIQPERYCFQHDNRTKAPFLFGWSEEANIQAAKLAKYPTLIIRTTESMYYGDEKEVERLVEIMKGNNAHTKLVPIRGGHYAHLIDAEQVAKIIGAFLREINYFEKVPESKI